MATYNSPLKIYLEINRIAASRISSA